MLLTRALATLINTRTQHNTDPVKIFCPGQKYFHPDKKYLRYTDKVGPAGRATHERLGDAVIMTHEADSFVPHGEMSQLRVENNIKRTLEVREAKN